MADGTATYAVPETEAVCGRCWGAGTLKVPEQAKRCTKGANGLLCDYEDGHPHPEGFAAHDTSINGSGVVEEMAKAVWEAELEWARAVILRAYAISTKDEETVKAELETIAREVASRRFQK